MLIPMFSAPRKYREQKCVRSEITSIDYKLAVVVRFKEKIIYKPVVQNIDDVVINNFEKIRMEAESYKFCLKIELTGNECEEVPCGSYRLERDYVVNKAKNSFEFKDKMNKLISNMPENREYEVEIVILEGPDGKVINSSICEEWTEYVAIY